MDRKTIGKWLCDMARWLGYEPPVVEKIIEVVVEVKPTPPPGYELPSPRATIREQDITIDGNGTVHIKGILPPVVKFTVPNTNSMEMAIDENHWVIASAHPSYKENLEIGEVIVFKTQVVNYNNFTVRDAEIIHAIWEIGEDAQGWYCKTKGWNPYLEIDPWIVRKNDISWVCRIVCW